MFFVQDDCSSSKLYIQGQSLEAAIHVPKTNGNRAIIESLAASSKLCHLDDSKRILKSHQLFQVDGKWHRFTRGQNGSPVGSYRRYFYSLSVSPVATGAHVGVSDESPQKEESLLIQRLKPEATTAASDKSNPPVDLYPMRLKMLWD